MQWQILQMWVFSVRSHWSHPLHKAETELLWNFGVSTCSIFKSYLEIFICHLVAAVPLLETDNTSLVCQYTIEMWSVLMACSSLVPERIAFCLQHSRTKHRYSAMKHSARSIWASRSYFLHFVLRYLVNSRNQAESTELLWFPPPSVEFCLVCSAQVEVLSKSSRNILCAMILGSYQSLVPELMLDRPGFFWPSYHPLDNSSSQVADWNVLNILLLNSNPPRRITSMEVNDPDLDAFESASRALRARELSKNVKIVKLRH